MVISLEERYFKGIRGIRLDIITEYFVMKGKKTQIWNALYIGLKDASMEGTDIAAASVLPVNTMNTANRMISEKKADIALSTTPIKRKEEHRLPGRSVYLIYLVVELLTVIYMSTTDPTRTGIPRLRTVDHFLLDYGRIYGAIGPEQILTILRGVLRGE